MKQGDHGLFDGNTASKEIIWVWIPGSIVLYVGVMVIALASTGSLNKVTIRTMLFKSLSKDWQRELVETRRLMVHGNRFAPFSLGIGLLLTLVFVLLGAEGDQYSCIMWDVNINSLGESFWRFSDSAIASGANQGRATLGGSAVLLLFIALHVAVVRCWGRVSAFSTDPSCASARAVLAGLRKIHELEMHQSLSYKSLNQWASNALGISGMNDYRGRYLWAHHSIKHVVCDWMLFTLLIVPSALFFSWPSLVYSLSRNVASSNAILQICRSPAVVTILQSMLNFLFLTPIVQALVKLRRVGLPHDELAFNQQRNVTEVLAGQAPV